MSSVDVKQLQHLSSLWQHDVHFIWLEIFHLKFLKACSSLFGVVRNSEWLVQNVDGGPAHWRNVSGEIKVHTRLFAELVVGGRWGEETGVTATKAERKWKEEKSSADGNENAPSKKD